MYPPWDVTGSNKNRTPRQYKILAILWTLFQYQNFYVFGYEKQL
jgi:hypothetical protein